MTEHEKYSSSRALARAWQRFAELDLAADKASKYHKRISRWVIVLGVTATLLAILTDNFTEYLGEYVLFNVLDKEFTTFHLLLVVLALVPIVGTALLNFSTTLQYGDNWLSLRSGAEEIRKEIYMYRTVMQAEKNRDEWLSTRTAEIQRHVHEVSAGDLVVPPYEGDHLPHQHDLADPNSDGGFNNLLANEYIHYRLDHQVSWHNGKMARVQKQRIRLLALTYAFMVTGSILSLLGWFISALPVWVALTSSVAAAITSWMELRRMDTTVKNYNKVVLELGIVRDHWYSLDGERRTGDQFFKMVSAVERVLWTQHSKYISEMRRAVAEMEVEDRDLLEIVLASPAPEPLEMSLKHENMGDAEREEHKKEEREEEERVVQAEAQAKNADLRVLKSISEALPLPKILKPRRLTAAQIRARRARPHAFVVMPFGRKQGFDGSWIDFNAVYADLIKPALIEAGFEPFRADDATETGDILTDMFQELLLADLAICDLSIDNANVFYELGIRHAFRKRGVVHIQSGRAYMPFDIFNVRTIPYQLDASGKPDPESLEKDIQTIARVTRDTWHSDRDAIHSPVFNLLSGLEEPDRKDLRTAAATGFWREYNEWKERMEVAKRTKRIGDILLLTEEISNPLIKEEAIGEAGLALKSLGQHELAIAQYRAGQELNNENYEFRRAEAFHLNRLGRVDEAIVKLENIIEEMPGDSEAIAALGRIYRQMWSESWENIEDSGKRKKEAFATAHWLVKSINTYTKAYIADQNNYYPGINALTWSRVLDSLATEYKEDSDPDLQAIREQLPALSGSVQLALEKVTAQEDTDYWSLASLAELYATASRNPKKVARAYKKALTTSKKDVQKLQSSLTQLELLHSLGIDAGNVKAGKTVLKAEIDRIKAEEDPTPEDDSDTDAPTEELIFLFAGHKLDMEDAIAKVFPPEMEEEVVTKLAEELDKLEADANDLGIAIGAAAGGDILFIEECLQRNMRVEILLPLDEPDYIKKHIATISDDWVTRYYNVRNHPKVSVLLQEELVGGVKDGISEVVRNNRWGMFSALGKGKDRMRFVALWNGESKLDTYGAIINDMVEDVRGLGGRVSHLNTSKFDIFQNMSIGTRKVDNLLEDLVEDVAENVDEKIDEVVKKIEDITATAAEDEKKD